MLTLKVVNTDGQGVKQTSVFSADHITHVESIIKAGEITKFTGAQYIGSLINESGDQPFVACDVILYNEDRTSKDRLLILPYSECFIMDNGKTVDNFYSAFK